MTFRLGSATDACELLGGISDATLRRLVKSKRLPEPIKFKENGRRYFDLDEIERVIADRKADREQGGKLPA